MKYVEAALGLAMFIAIGYYARSAPRVRYLMLFALGCIPFTEVIWRLSAMLIGTFYRGDTQGVDLTIMDLLAVSLFIALPPSRYPPPFRALTALYVFSAIASVLVAWVPEYALFAIWRLVRSVFLGVVVARAFEDVRAPQMLLAGYSVGLFCELCSCLWFRYVRGFYQTAGTFPHQNSLGMAVNITVPVLFALVLARAKGRYLAGLAVLSGMVCIVLALSRGSLMMFGLAMVIVYLGSIARKPTAYKIGIGVSGLAVVIGVGIKAADSIINRFQSASSESARARVLFEAAARGMLHDSVGGIGMNNFSHVLLAGGYGHEAGIKGYDITGVVHNIYWLTASEMGYVGVVAYVLLCAAPILVALHGTLRAGDDIRGDVLLGCFAGLVVFQLQGKLEWIARQPTMSYIVWMQYALVIGLWRQLREARILRSLAGRA